MEGQFSQSASPFLSLAMINANDAVVARMLESYKASKLFVAVGDTVEVLNNLMLPEEGQSL